MSCYNDYKGTGIPKFPADSRVCFLGDSLTSGSIWVQIIFDYYLKNFPKENIRIYDCGVGQGTADFGLSTLSEDVYLHDPTHVVIMYGHNDINCARGDAKAKEYTFYNNLKNLVDELLSKGITVYLMSEPLYSAELWGEVRTLANAAVQKLAKEYNIPLCDFFNIYSPIVKEGMVHEDLVHITPLGGSVLARVFLHAQGFDGFTPDDEGFYDMYEMSYDLDHRKIFSDKLRIAWLAMRSISTYGDTTEAKIARIRERIKTRADGAWDDFCYYRAVDFIELYPHMDFYREIMESVTDEMIRKASEGIYN